MHKQLEAQPTPVLQTVLDQLDFEEQSVAIVIQRLERHHGNPALSGRAVWQTLPDERYPGNDRLLVEAALRYLRHKNMTERYRSVRLIAEVIDE